MTPDERKQQEQRLLDLRRRKQKKLQSQPEGGLFHFIEYFWDVLEPNTPLVDGWALRAICAHLEAVTRGEINRLLINVPPGFMKSLLTDVFWPAWEWGPMGMPHLRYVSFSYSAGLTERDNAKFRDLILSKKYKDLWGDTFEAKKVGEVKVTNSKTGSKLATSVGGIGTGERGDRIICFPPEELVATATGPIPIGHLVKNKIQTEVWSYNLKTQSLELQPIIGWHKNPARSLVKITTEDGASVTSTLDHRLLTSDGYREAGSLSVGDCLLAAPRRVLIPSSDVRLPQVQVQMLPNPSASNATDCPHTNPVLFTEHLGRIVMSCRNLSDKLFGQVRRTVAKSSVLLAVRNVLRSSSVFKVLNPSISAISVLVSNLLALGHRAKERRCHQLMAEPIDCLAVVTQGDTRITLVEDGGHYLSRDGQGVPSSDHGPWTTPHSAKTGNLVASFQSNHIPPDFVRVVSVEHIKDLPSATYCITTAENHNLCCGSLATIIASNCDDPHNVKDGESEVIRGETVRWFREALSNRLNNMEKSAIVVIMQRVHEADVSGTILTEGFDYTHLMIPMEYDPGRHCATSIGWEDPRTEEGELAWPERFPEEVTAELKTNLGPYAYAGQYQQAPAPRGGGLFKRDWWQLYESDDGSYPPLEFVLVSADTAYTAKESNDPSACTVWGVFREKGAPRIILLYAWRKFLELHGKYEPRSPVETTSEYHARTKPHWGLVEWLAYTCQRYRADRLIVEGKASGLSVVQELQRLYGNEPWGVEIVQPLADKIARAHAVQPIFSQLLVYAPDRDWADMVIDEMNTFPKGRYKDLTDSTTQAMKWLRDTGLIVHRHESEYEDQEALRYKQKPAPLYPV